jgi:SAM-dependent methyltransferase
MAPSGQTTWPKQLPELNAEQLRIRDDYMRYFHENLSGKFGAIARFNHTYVLPSAPGAQSTIDIGAGLGEHAEFEDLRGRRYVAVELREEMAAAIRRAHPEVHTVVGDIQNGLDVEDASFDRALVIHVLEHLPNLPAALDEIRRILRPGGVLEVVVPCEGGLVYGLGRRLTTQRMFEKRYGVAFDWCIESEHVNVPSEITAELDARFVRTRRSFFPFKLASVNLNICIGLSYTRP